MKIARRFNAGWRCERTTSPEGTAEPVKPRDNARRIRRDALSARQKLLLECHVAMMFLLVSDVSDD